MANRVTKLTYRPLSLGCSIIGGALAGAVFTKAWRVLGEGGAPKPTQLDHRTRGCSRPPCMARCSVWYAPRSTGPAPRATTGSPARTPTPALPAGWIRPWRVTGRHDDFPQPTSSPSCARAPARLNTASSWSST